tara:strand:+ start:389 stop:727 length:339 start_codon:yes stop_codon:yes gene_type:complete
MRITKLDAIKSLCPTVDLTVEGDSTITFWSDDSVAKPTDSQITTEQARLQSIEDWSNNRRIGTATTSGYGTFSSQLDQLYHDMKDGKLGAAATTGSWYVGISSVKSAFPKLS